MISVKKLPSLSKQKRHSVDNLIAQSADHPQKVLDAKPPQ